MRILTDCGSCGNAITIEPSTARLILFRPSPVRRRLAARFEYECPLCGDRCDAPITEQEEVRLIDIGVPVDVVADPREHHPSTMGRRVRSGAVLEAPQFTEADVQALREELSREDWIDRLLEQM